jgi:2-C-methyl-D-erythritol 4-phosphate cytidylyltransferase
MGNELPKQYLSLNNRPMIYHTINTLCQNQLIAGVFVVLAPNDDEWFKYDWSEFTEKLIVLSCGGLTRADSVLNGLTAAKQKNLVDTNDWILVHDAARPCLTSILLDKLINELTIDNVGGLLAVPVADTLKRSNTDNRVAHTESRENLWQAQTPQMFRYDLLTQALRSAANINVTDDASAVEALGFHPKLVLGDAYNFKVTYPQDLALAELILQKRNNS